MERLETLCREIQDGHHAFLRDILPRLTVLLAACLGAAPEVRRPPLQAMAGPLRELAEDIETHMIKEERILFPAVIAAERAASRREPGPGREDRAGGAPEAAVHESILASVRPLMFDHERAESTLRRLEAAVAALEKGPEGGEAVLGLAAGVAALSADLREHIRKEEEDLFVAALRLENAIFFRHGQTLDKEDAG